MIYVGRHKTDNPNDGYLGSGKDLLKAVKIFGSTSFQKEILFIFDNPEEMILKEKEIVNEAFVDRLDTYNIALGITTWGHLGHRHTEEAKQKIREKRKLQVFTQETYDKIAAANTGKKHPPRSQESRDKSSASSKGKKKPPFTQEHRDNLSKSRKGKPLSEKQLNAMKMVGLARRGNPSPAQIAHNRRIAADRKGKKFPRTEERKIELRKNRFLKKITMINSLIAEIIKSKMLSIYHG